MRIPGRGIPIYRAFPELDQFSDAECRHWMKLSWEYWPRRRLLIAALGPIAAIAAFILAAAGFIGMLTIPKYTWYADSSGLVFFGVLIAVTIVPGTGIALIVYTIRDRWLRDCLRAFIADRRCGCGYSLVGLPERRIPQGVVIICPECGTPRRVRNLGGPTAPGGVSCGP